MTEQQDGTQRNGTQQDGTQRDETQPRGGPAARKTIAGRYALREIIGRGGMGVVWLADDVVIGRPVAIKELRLPDGLAGAEREVYQERVLREARTTGRLNDPSVVTVFDVVSEHGSTYIVMELIQAPTLAELMREHGTLPAEQVLAIAEQVLSALEGAHAAGIVHRDVKPSNIMVLAGGRVKLTDFGIAQALDDPRLTTSGTLVGSPSYMAPERISHSAATPASDMWSFGATLFHAVEGYSPFERASTAATMHAIMTEAPRLHRCGGPLATIITGLLIATPEARLNATGVRGLLGAAAQHATAAHHPGPGQTQGMYSPNGTMLYRGAQTGAVQPPPGRARRNSAALLLAAALGVAGGYFLLPLLAGQDSASEYLTYGPNGQIAEFDVSTSSSTCLVGQVEAGRSFSDSSSPSCDEPHDAEVYWTSSFTDSSSPQVGYPGVEALGRYAGATCAMIFDSKQVTPEDKAESLRYVSLVPTAEQFRADLAESGAPSVVCVLSRKDGAQLRQSVLLEGN